MKRTRLVRIQIILVVVVAILLIWRATVDSPIPDAAVAMTGLETGSLYSTTFELDQSARLQIDAVGSVETRGSSLHAAYPWILRDGSAEPVWRLDAGVDVEDLTLVSFLDTVAFEAGRYTAYYTTFGPTPGSRKGGSFLGLIPYWTNDQKKWRFAVSPVDSVGIRVSPTPVSTPSDEAVFWSSGLLGDNQRAEVLLVADGPGQITVDAVAETCSTGCDHVLLDDARTGTTVWQMTTENSTAAGGWIANRAFNGPITVPEGIYWFRVKTDGTHGYGSWRANPPWNPEAWGARLAVAEGSVRTLDPWSDIEPVVSLLQVGNDELRRAGIRVTRRALVVIDAIGEISSGGSRYDYAWIEAADTRSRVWDMQFDNTSPAGGSETNRRETAVVTLDPGIYMVYYQSDGSHAFGDWRRPHPPHPERWGVAIFPVDRADGDSAAVTLLTDLPHDPNLPDGGDSVAPPDEPPPPLPPIAGETIFQAVAVGNESDRSGTFELSRPTRVRIVALGEITRSGRYDYGWIETQGGEYPWEMTINNTVAAGGDARNRLFDGVITLPAGRYTARFKTDFSHAYGDFGQGSPAQPGAWGMRIVRMPE